MGLILVLCGPVLALKCQAMFAVSRWDAQPLIDRGLYAEFLAHATASFFGVVGRRLLTPGFFHAPETSHCTPSARPVRMRAPPVIGSVRILSTPPVLDRNTISASSELPLG